MRFLIQKVSSAKVIVDDLNVGEIADGLLLFVGITHGDTEQIADALVDKVMRLRIFEDENKKLNLSIQNKKGSILVVSQFTLYANCSKGTRPSFVDAAKPEHAKFLYDYIISKFDKYGLPVKSGEFGEYMSVKLVNEGPLTIMLEK